MNALAVLVLVLVEPHDQRPWRSDAERLPPLPVLLAQMEECEAWQKRLNQRLLLAGHWWPAAEAAKRESIQIRQWLELAIIARKGSGYLTDAWPNEAIDWAGFAWCYDCPRDALNDMRQMMGNAAYYAGWWPASTPWWRGPLE
jgi:hypothetical protein